MSLVSNLELYVNRVAAEFRTIRGIITGSPTGDLSTLSTTDKSSIIAAINEIQSIADTAQTPAEVQALIDAAVASLVDGSPGVLDTLNELAAALGDDPNFATTIAAQIATKANAADVYTKTEIGDVTTDFVATFEATLTAP